MSYSNRVCIDSQESVYTPYYGADYLSVQQKGTVPVRQRLEKGRVLDASWSLQNWRRGLRRANSKVIK